MWIGDFVATLDQRPYTSREFLNRLGGHLWKETQQNGILTAAYRAGVPIFCPAIADSSIGMGLSQGRHKRPRLRPHRRHRRHRRVGKPRDSPAAHRHRRARRRHAEELHQSGERPGRVLQPGRRRAQIRAADRDRRAALRRSLRLDARRGAELGQAGDRCGSGDGARRRHDRAADSRDCARAQLVGARREAQPAQHRSEPARDADRRQTVSREAFQETE